MILDVYILVTRMRVRGGKVRRERSDGNKLIES